MLTNDQRYANVAAHAAVLQDLLDRQPSEGSSQRVYRARAIIRDVYTVISLVQNLPGFQPPAGGSDIRLRLYVDTPSSLASATFSGQFAVDELVAFCGLDMIDLDHLEWRDETKYTSGLLIANNMLRSLMLPE